MAVCLDQVGPAIIVIVKEHHAPAQILSVGCNSRRIGQVRKRAIAVVVVESRGVIGKVCLEDVKLSVPVIIRNGCAHTSLFTSVLVVSHAAQDGYVGEGSISIVAVKNVGCAVAGYI